MSVGIRLCFLVYLVVIYHCIVCENNTTKLKAVEEYITHCPSTALCTRVPPFSLFVSCCGECYCDVNCSNNCCPDGPQDFLTQTEIEDLKRNDIMKCLKPSIHDDVLASKQFYYKMIGACPFGFENGTIKDKCLSPFQVFDFGEGVYNIPVTETETGITYKNLYCAVCNDADTAHMITWKAVLLCFKFQVKPAINFLMHVEIISIEGLSAKGFQRICNVIFEPPTIKISNLTDMTIETCSGVIDRCNVTGTWKGESVERDYEIETACLSYTSEYVGYRNIHCFLCNGGDLADATSCSLVSTFYSSVNYTLAIQNVMLKAGMPCNSTSVFDNSTGTCRALICSKGFVLVGEKCVPFIQPRHKTYLYQVYEAILTFEPDFSSLTKRVTTASIVDFFEKAEENFYKGLPLNKSADQIYVCDRRAFIKFRQSQVDLVNTLRNERRKVLFFDVMYMAISFRITVEGVDDIFEVLDDLLFIYNTTSVTINGDKMNHVPRIIDRNLVDKIFENKTEHSKTRQYVDAEMVKALELNAKVETALLNSTTDESDGLAVAPLEIDLLVIGEQVVNRCLDLARLEENVFCPKIKLFRDEFTTDEQRVFIKSLNSYVDRNEGQFGSGFNEFYLRRETFQRLMGDRDNINTSKAVPIYYDMLLFTGIIFLLML